MEHLASTVIIFIVAPLNPFVGPSSKTKISLFLLSIWTEELLSTPEIIAFLPQWKSGSKKSERESNQIPYSE